MDEMIRETDAMDEMIRETDAMVTTDDVTVEKHEESKCWSWTPAQCIGAVGAASFLAGTAIAATAIIGTKVNDYVDMSPLERAEYRTKIKKEKLDIKLAKAKAKADKKAAKAAKNKGENPEKKGGD